VTFMALDSRFHDIFIEDIPDFGGLSGIFTPRPGPVGDLVLA
jgi:hypothetical protein